MHVRAFRDRHGRGQRGPLLPQALPRHSTRSQRFDAEVLEAYAPYARRFSEQLRSIDIAVDTVPRMRLQITEEVCADGTVPLGRIIPAGIDANGTPTRPRIVIFRKPIEHRCINATERNELLKQVFCTLLATYLNVTPEMIDPDYSA